MKVGIARTEPRYPPPPFHPSEPYPELAGAEIAGQENHVYRAVRDSLRQLGLDAARAGTAAWNPLGDLIGPGSRVVIKPNFVNHYNPLSDDRGHFEALVTQAAVMRPLLDYVLIATKGECVVTFADLPIQSADFSAIARQTGLAALMENVHASSWPNATFEMLDLRPYRLVTERSGAVIERQEQPGDPRGYATIDLGRASSLAPIEEHAHLFRAPDYDGDATARLHSGGSHKYVLPKTILAADLFINVPKLKVHRKVGATLCLKNLVGIIGDKTCLPHWRAGAPASHGDEFAVGSAINTIRARYSFALRKLGGPVWKIMRPMGRWLARANQAAHRGDPLSSIINGDWYGNDTIWRMVHDLNRIIMFADAEGRLHDVPQRRYLGVVDGVVGGEGEGPLSPRPVHSGVVVAGMDPLATDIVCCGLMGLNWRRIPQFSCFDRSGRYPFSDLRDERDIELVDRGLVADVTPVHRFEPSRGWKGHVEL